MNDRAPEPLKWSGACAIVDHGAADRQHVTCVEADHQLWGYQLQCQPGSGLGTNPTLPIERTLGDPASRRQRFLAELLSSLYSPVYFVGTRTDLPPTIIPTLEIRLLRGPDAPLEALLLVKIATPLLPGQPKEKLSASANEHVTLIHDRVSAACQGAAELDPLQFASAPLLRESLKSALTAAGKCRWFGEVRRENLWPHIIPPPTFERPASYQTLHEALHRKVADAVLPWGFLQWPIQPSALFLLREMMQRRPEAAVVALRFQPAYLSNIEKTWLHKLIQSLHAAASSFHSPANIAMLEGSKLLLQRLATNCRLFATNVEVATDHSDYLDVLLNLLSGGIRYFRPPHQGHFLGTTMLRSGWAEEAASLAAIRSFPVETGLCRYNMEHLEFLSWGGLSDDTIPDYWAADHCPDDLPPKPEISEDDKEQLANLWPAFAARDMIPQAELSRLRKILTFEEAMNVWTACF